MAGERYRKISIRTWGDEAFCALSKPAPNAQTLWFYLLTGPHTTPIPGVFSIGRLGLAEALDWPVEDFDRCFAEISSKGLARADWKSRFVWLPKALNHNEPESPNVVRSWRETWKLQPECALKAEAYEHLKGFLKAFGEGFAKAFDEACRKPLAKAKPYQEQEQEQEQDTPRDLPRLSGERRGKIGEAYERLTGLTYGGMHQHDVHGWVEKRIQGEQTPARIVAAIETITAAKARGEIEGAPWGAVKWLITNTHPDEPFKWGKGKAAEVEKSSGERYFPFGGS